MTYNQKIPPFKWFILENFPYIEEDFDALTNWQLFCKLGKEMNKIIEKCNLTGEQVERLTTAFNELKAYIDDYFENLDLQDEVNTKLDEMAESGELADIIAQYVNIQSVLAYDDKADMKSAENLINGSICRTLGDLSYSDGKGALYKIREVLTTDVIDDENIIAIHNPELIAEKISYSSGYDLQQNINTNTSRIANDERNSKYIAYIYCEDEPRQSVAYIRNALELFVEAGFKETQMTIHINNDGTLAEDETKFADYNSIANELNIPIKSIKFHGNYTATNYLDKILEVLEYFPNVETCFIFNEQLEEVANYGTTFPASIKHAFPNIKKVGFTAPYNKCFFGNDMTPSLWNGLIQNFDVMGVHMYPSCTTFDNSSMCNYENVIDAFNNPQFVCPWNKEIWITESGVLPYWQFMEWPENYDTSKLTDTTFDVEPQRIFFRALANCNMAQRAVKVIPWFLESGISDTNHTLFRDILKNIIRGN